MNHHLTLNAATFKRFSQLVTPLNDANSVLNQLMDLVPVPHPPTRQSEPVTRNVHPSPVQPTRREPVGATNLPQGGDKPERVEVLGSTASARSWKDVIVHVANTLAARGELKSQVLSRGGRRTLVAQTNEGMHNARKLKEGGYIETNWSGTDTIKRSCQLLQACGHSENELKVWLR